MWTRLGQAAARVQSTTWCPLRVQSEIHSSCGKPYSFKRALIDSLFKAVSGLGRVFTEYCCSGRLEVGDAGENCKQLHARTGRRTHTACAGRLNGSLGVTTSLPGDPSADALFNINPPIFIAGSVQDSLFHIGRQAVAWVSRSHASRGSSIQPFGNALTSAFTYHFLEPWAVGSHGERQIWSSASSSCGHGTFREWTLPGHMRPVVGVARLSGGVMKNNQGQEIPSTHGPLIPIDPGRVNVIDPLELQYWCDELQCTQDDLSQAVAEVGEHVTAVRAQLVSRRLSGQDKP